MKKWITFLLLSIPIQCFGAFKTDNLFTSSVTFHGDGSIQTTAGISVSSVSANFITKSSASATYLRKTDAANSYVSTTTITNYLSTTSANSTYLTQSSATATYLQMNLASSTYLTKSSATVTYQPVGSYLTTSSATATYIPWTSSNTIGGSGATNLDGLTDVTITAPAKNQAILYNGTAWVNAAQGTSFTFSISAFSNSAGSNNAVFEIGNGTWKAIGSMSFSATYNNGPATNGYVSHSGWSNLTLGGTGYVGPTTNTEASAYPSVGGTKVYTLNATDGSASPTSSITYYFYNRRFWGVSSVASGYTEANVEGLANNELSNSKAKTFTLTAGSGEYIIYSYPSRLGTATFTVGGFEGGFNSPETVSITNSSGYSENFYVYRSINSNLGSTTVVAN